MKPLYISNKKNLDSDDFVTKNLSQDVLFIFSVHLVTTDGQNQYQNYKHPQENAFLSNCKKKNGLSLGHIGAVSSSSYKRTVADILHSCRVMYSEQEVIYPSPEIHSIYP